MAAVETNVSVWVTRLIKAVIVGLCLYLAYVAGKWGLADYYSEQSYQITRSWANGEVTEESWQKNHGLLDKALSLDPIHPTYNHRMGRLYHIRMGMKPLERDKYGALAKQHFEHSLEIRPYWPLTWANLALVKRDLREFDERFFEATVNAARYGPWEPGVHQILASIGLPYTFVFADEPEAKAAIVGSVTRGLRSPVSYAPREVLVQLKQSRLSVDAELIAALENMLLDHEWDRNTEVFTEVALLFWNRWSDGVPQELARKIAGAADRRVLNVVDQYDKLMRVCPWMQRDDNFDRYCR